MFHRRSFISGSICLGICINPCSNLIAQQSVKKDSDGEALHNISSNFSCLY